MQVLLPLVRLFVPIATLHEQPVVAKVVIKPLWPVVLGTSLMVLFTFQLMLRLLWPTMKRKTAWLISIAASLIFLLILSPVAVEISNILRSGRSM